MVMGRLPKVLIVEDEEDWHINFRRLLSGHAVTLTAKSIDEARELFRRNSDLAVIVVDACVPGFQPTTVPLVQEFRKMFTGPIVAVSSVNEYRDMLCAAGCDHECEKPAVATKVMKLLVGIGRR